MSFGKITKYNKITSIGDVAKSLNYKNKSITIAYKSNNTYKIESFINSKKVYISEKIECTMTLKKKFHKILGHVNFKYLDVRFKNNLVDGFLNQLQNEYLKFGSCV